MKSPTWLTTAQAAEHLGFFDAAGQPDVHLFASWKNKLKSKGKHLPTYRLAGTTRSLRYKQVDLDRMIEPESSAIESLEEGARHLRMVGR